MSNITKNYLGGPWNSFQESDKDEKIGPGETVFGHSGAYWKLCSFFSIFNALEVGSSEK